MEIHHGDLHNEDGNAEEAVVEREGATLEVGAFHRGTSSCCSPSSGGGKAAVVEAETQTEVAVEGADGQTDGGNHHPEA